MPYITKDKRDELDGHINNLATELIKMGSVDGNLNYVITRLLMYLYGDKDSTRYVDINRAMGVMSCASLEYYRKVASPYEDVKEMENGPVDHVVRKS